ncbi:MAG: helix-turn-helix transcriptional regulator [Clostridia bacterium]|nr:helix-turn-helix transcriptional regulator [Clostridia bacterium]
MNHIPIIDTELSSRQIEVTHHNYDAPKGHWNKTKICRDNIKINFFIEGDFSVFINDTRYRPVCGDICFLPPARIHCGQVESQTHLDYFQLDIGVQALDCISGGGDLLAELITCSNGRFFIHPNPEEERRILKLCYHLESAVTQNNKPLAFAYTVEILALIKYSYTYSDNTSCVALSETTTAIIDYIKEHYYEKITASLLSDLLGFSTTYLSATFKKEIGMSIHAYLTEYRVMRSAALLKDHSIADTCYLCGFYDSSHFIAAFKKRFNCTPAVYKRQFP